MRVLGECVGEVRGMSRPQLSEPWQQSCTVCQSTHRECQIVVADSHWDREDIPSQHKACQEVGRLARKGFHFIGDSAYSIKSFLITPYDNAIHGTAEDNFNFFHSSSRISVECCFGEIDLCWGIFWRELNYSLKTNVVIIDACMRLHNFIVERRDEDNELFATSEDFSVFNEDCWRFYAVHPFVDNEGVYGGESDVRRGEDGKPLRGGCPNWVENASTEYGRKWRDLERDKIC